MTSFTREIADFASAFTRAKIPEAVLARAKNIVLDGLGCGLYASDVKWTQILTSVIRRLEPNGGQVSIWGRPERASATNAALVNGTMVQGYELDDAHPGSIHSCAIVLPAALAAAEMLGAERVTGRSLLLAIIAGFEIGARVGLCMSGERMVLNGWHPGAIVGPFPAAIAAGSVLGLDSDQLFHALGIAGTQACGLMAAQYGSMVKRMQCGKAAQNGLYAALLAAEGFTGIEDIFEQPFGGFCSTFSRGKNEFDLSKLVAGLGERWETLRIITKTYACRAGNHTAVNAIDELVKETGLAASDVEEIRIGVTEGMVKHAGWWPYEPKGLTAAQMHAGFCVAMRLIEGDVFVDQMVEENIARPDLVDLANRVRLRRSLEREQKGDKYRKGCDMEVRLKNGKVLRKTVEFALGTEQRPLSAEQIALKYRRLAAKTFPMDKVLEIERLVHNIDRADSVTPLVNALKCGR